MHFLGDYVEFARPKGAKDKKPRRRRNYAMTSAGLGIIGGSLYSAGRDGYQVGKVQKMGLDGAGAAAELASRRVSPLHTLKRGGAGAVAGLGAYGAYKGIRHLNARRKNRAKR